MTASVDVRGDGLPVLFVHGFPLDRTMWRHQMTGLARCRRIAPDLWGPGAANTPAGGYSMSRYADDLIAVLDGLDVPQAVVCGLSMGGYVVFDLVRRHARRLKAVVLADTRAEADSDEAKRARDEMAALAEGEGARAVADRMIPKMLAQATRQEQPELVAEVRRMMERWSVAGLVGALRAMRDRPDSTETLAAIDVPALVLVGEEDQVTPPADARRMAAAIRGARFVTIPAAGHLAPLEQPLAAGRALADFVESLT